jgi:hypothetical protein
MEVRLLLSWKIPTLSGLFAKNQSRLNPFQGRDGKLESLKARTQVTTRGANKNK